MELKTKLLKSKTALIALSLLAVAGVWQGCNLFGGIDDAEDKEEKVSQAQALMDQEKCDEAIKVLDTVNPKDDDVYQMMGWAQLCVGGASLGKVGKSLLTYSSSTNNLTVVGNLANNMIPSTETSIARIQEAARQFEKQNASNDRAFNLAFARIIEAAAVIAMATSDGAKVVKADVGSSACVASVCDISSTCPVNSNNKMNNQDVVRVAGLLSQASQAIGGFSGLGAAADLAARLGALASTTVPQMTRCAIYNQMLPQ